MCFIFYYYFKHPNGVYLLNMPLTVLKSINSYKIKIFLSITLRFRKITREI